MCAAVLSMQGIGSVTHNARSSKQKTMSLLRTFIVKEFKHILRDTRTLLILFGMPIVQIVLFGFALTNEVKNTKIAILDLSLDVATKQITSRLHASNYFDVTETPHGYPNIENVFKRGNAKMVVVFPQNFREELLHTNKATVQLLADASDPNVATTITNYATSIINDYALELNNQPIPYSIKPEIRMLYNPQQKGAYNFVPGVIAMVLMLVCVLMTSVAVVREKETGTMEILLVSPMRPIVIIISKAVPYLVLGMVIVGVILILSITLLDVPINGSLWLLLAESVLFILTSLAIGLVISNITSSQQTAMLVSLMLMMLPTILLSGFMFPIENLPLPMQIISNALPARWFFIIVKTIMIKGLGFSAVMRETAILTGMAFLFLTIGVTRFKERL